MLSTVIASSLPKVNKVLLRKVDKSCCDGCMEAELASGLS